MLCRYAPAQQHRLDPYPLLRTPVDSGGYAGWITPNALHPKALRGIPQPGETREVVETKSRRGKMQNAW